MTPDFSSLPLFLRPRIKLFLSVDLIDSTKLKHEENVLGHDYSKIEKLDDIGADWFRALTHFYGTFEKLFSSTWRRAWDLKDEDQRIANLHWTKGDEPRLWKVAGDELIYVLDVSHPGEIVVALIAWQRTLHDYRRALKDHTWSLDVKATAWMAGFPIANHEVVFWRNVEAVDIDDPLHDGKFGQYYRLNEWYEDNIKGAAASNTSNTNKADIAQKQKPAKARYFKDYIGPSVDTGFRLAEHASARLFPVSLEIVYFLSKVTMPDHANDCLKLCYLDRRRMKGVLGGQPYPIFCLSSVADDDALLIAENEFRKAEEFFDPKKAKPFLNAFFSDKRNFLFKPFVAGASEPEFAEIPPKYPELLQQTAAIWTSEYEKREFRDRTTPPDGQGNPIEGNSLAKFRVPKSPKDASD